MRKTITVKYLKKMGACKEAIDSFKAQDERDTIKLLRKYLKLDHFDWANWLIVRLMNRKQQLRYAIYTAELVLPIWEEKYPDDKRPYKAIRAAKKVLKRDSKENREVAYVAAHAAYAAACAAAAAEAVYAAAYAAACADRAADVVAYAATCATARAATCADRAARTADAKSKIIEYGIKILKR